MVEGVLGHALTRIRLMAVMMSTLHVGLLISKLPMNCIYKEERKH